MTTTNIDDAHVFPEDLGTDAPEDYSQPDSAGYFGGLARHELLLQYVGDGLGLNPDYGTGSLDITEGIAHLFVNEPVAVQDQNGDYSKTWRSGIGIAVDVPETQGLSLTSGEENHVFLGVDMSEGDGAYYEINTSDEQPAAPYLKLGVVDTETETATLENRGIGLATDASIESLEDDVSSLDGRVTTNEGDIDTLETDVSALETDLSDHETGGNHDQLSGGVVGRSEPVTHIEGNVWHLQEGESLPSEAEFGDTVIRY